MDPASPDVSISALTGPVACRAMDCNGSCGLLSIHHYHPEAASKPLPTKQRCEAFARDHGLDPVKVAHCALYATRSDRRTDAIVERAAAYHVGRFDALEALWTAVKDKEHWQMGYSPEFTTAVDRLRKLEADPRNQADGCI